MRVQVSPPEWWVGLIIISVGVHTLANTLTEQQQQQQQQQL
jgi:hypothetical protein